MSETWRDDPFGKGCTYRVRKDFAAMRDTFREGEILKYDRSAYTHYHGVSGFFFTDSHGNVRSWDVSDDEPLSAWSDFFEKQNAK